MADSLDETSGQEAGGADQSPGRSAIDALFGNAGDGESAASSTPAGGPADRPPGVQHFSQTDIDALLSAASAAQSAGDAESAAEDGPLPAMQAAVEEERAGAARAAEREASAPAVPPGGLPLQPFALPDLRPAANPDIDARRVTMLNDVNLRVKVELGRTRMLVEDVLKLGEGSVVELDKPAGDPVDVYVNDRLVARGEVLVLADNFCVRVTEVISSDPHRVSA